MANILMFESFSNQKKTEELCSMLFSLRTKLHQQHLQTDSYSQHKALQKAYETLVDQIDTLIETYQGDKDKTLKYQEYSFKDTDNKNILKHCKAECIAFGIKSEDEDSHLKNILDEIVANISQTLYLLTLK